MAILLRTGADLNSKRITSLADPTGANDAANKQYVDNVARGLSWKDSVRAASTSNWTIASALINGASMDGVTLVTGDRVLLKDQSTGSQNGIYTVAASGAAPRAADADADAEVKAGMAVTVTEGTQNGDKSFLLTTNNPITVGTTSLSFSQLGGGTPYTAGNGLTLTGSAFSVVTPASSGLTVDGTGVYLDGTIAARIYQADCSATTNPQNFTHGLGKRPVVSVVRVTDGVVVLADVTVTTTQITVDWGAAPTASEYRVVAVG